MVKGKAWCWDVCQSTNADVCQSTNAHCTYLRQSASSQTITSIFIAAGSNWAEWNMKDSLVYTENLYNDSLPICFKTNMKILWYHCFIPPCTEILYYMHLRQHAIYSWEQIQYSSVTQSLKSCFWKFLKKTEAMGQFHSCLWCSAVIWHDHTSGKALRHS